MKRKVDILLMVMFLFGSMIFLCPIFGQIKEVEEDDRVYTRMSAEVKPPQQASGLVEDAPSPAAAAAQTVLPLLLEVPQAEKTAVRHLRRQRRSPLLRHSGRRLGRRSPLPRRPPYARLLPTLPRQHRQSGQQIPAVSM